jgi:type IV secretion system protein VirD4
MALLKHTLALAVLGGAMLLILFTWRHRRRSAATAAEHGLVHIPKADQDLTRYYAASMALFLVLALASCWAATEYAAWAFNWPAVFGGCTWTAPAGGTPLPGAVPAAARWVCGPHLYEPFAIFVWIFKYERLTRPAQAAIFDRAHAIVGIGFVLALIAPMYFIFRRSQRIKNERNDLHGSAHWAAPKEVEATKLLPSPENRGGVVFGAWRDPSGRVHYLRHKGPEHMMVFAPTRSGKGVGIVIPTLVSWDESVLVLDIKGENWALTSGFRERVLKQRALKFDPTALDSARFNPLLEIRLDLNMVKDVQNICTLIVDPDGRGLEDHWAKTAFDLLVGVVIFVLVCESPEGVEPDRSLATVLGILSDGGVFREVAETSAEARAQAAAEKAAKAGAQGAAPKKPAQAVAEGAKKVLEYIEQTALDAMRALDAAPAEGHAWRARRNAWLTVAAASRAWLNKPANEGGSVLSTALSFLSLYRDPIVADNTRVSDFSVESLMGGKNPDGQAVKEKTSLYLVVPPSDKDRLKPLLRIVVSQVVRRLTEGMDFDTGGGKSRFPHRLLLLIDEFPSLGKLEIFEEALAFIAGYGMKALLIVQDRVQLAKSYTKEESIFSNCHIRIAYAPNNPETADMLSKMCGQATVTHVQRQYSGNRMHIMLQNVNTNEQIVGRPLLTADECMRLPSDDEIVFVAGTAPIYCQKIKYYGDSAMAARTALGMAASTGRSPDAPPPPDGAVPGAALHSTLGEVLSALPANSPGGDDAAVTDTDGEEIE